MQWVLPISKIILLRRLSLDVSASASRRIRYRSSGVSVACSAFISIRAKIASRSAEDFCFAKFVNKCTAFSGALFVIMLSASSCGCLLISVILLFRLVGQNGMTAGCGFSIAVFCALLMVLVCA